MGDADSNETPTFKRKNEDVNVEPKKEKMSDVDADSDETPPSKREDETMEPKKEKISDVDVKDPEFVIPDHKCAVIHILMEDGLPSAYVLDRPLKESEKVAIKFICKVDQKDTSLGVNLINLMTGSKETPEDLKDMKLHLGYITDIIRSKKETPMDKEELIALATDLSLYSTGFRHVTSHFEMNIQSTCPGCICLFFKGYD